MSAKILNYTDSLLDKFILSVITKFDWAHEGFKYNHTIRGVKYQITVEPIEINQKEVSK